MTAQLNTTSISRRSWSAAALEYTGRNPLKIAAKKFYEFFEFYLVSHTKYPKTVYGSLALLMAYKAVSDATTGHPLLATTAIGGALAMSFFAGRMSGYTLEQRNTHLKSLHDSLRDKTPTNSPA